MLVQCSLRIFVMKPLLGNAGVLPALNNNHFAFLVLSTLLIAAGGYIINDYFDTKQDSIKKVKPVLVGTVYNRRLAILLHLSFTGLGIAIAAFISIANGLRTIFLLQALIAGLLWFYSTDYKKQALIGNIIIGILSASILLLVPAFEPNIWKLMLNGDETQKLFIKLCITIIGFYATATFLIAFSKSVIKEMESSITDAKLGFNTLAIWAGVPIARTVASVALLCFLALTGYVQYLQLQGQSVLQCAYIFVGLQIPALVAFFYLLSGRYLYNYKIIFLLLDIIMVAGALSMLIFYLG